MVGCARCGKPFRSDFEDGTRLLNGEDIHESCRTAEEYFEQLLGGKLEDVAQGDPMSDKGRTIEERINAVIVKLNLRDPQEARTLTAEFADVVETDPRVLALVEAARETVRRAARQVSDHPRDCQCVFCVAVSTLDAALKPFEK